MDRLFERKSVKTQKHIYFYLKFVQTHEQTLKAETFVTVSYKIFLHIQSFFDHLILVSNSQETFNDTSLFQQHLRNITAGRP